MTAKSHKEYKSLEDLPLTLRVQEVADIMRINKTKAYELAHREDFPSLKIGQRIVIPRNAFSNWLENQAMKR